MQTTDKTYQSRGYSFDLGMFLRNCMVAIDLLSHFVENLSPALRFSTRHLSENGKSLKKARLADFTPVLRRKRVISLCFYVKAPMHPTLCHNLSKRILFRAVFRHSISQKTANISKKYDRRTLPRFTRKTRDLALFLRQSADAVDFMSYFVEWHVLLWRFRHGISHKTANISKKYDRRTLPPFYAENASSRRVFETSNHSSRLFVENCQKS